MPETHPLWTAPSLANAYDVLDYQQFTALTNTLMRTLEPAELLRFHEALTQEPKFAAVRLPDDGKKEDEAGRELREISKLLPIVAYLDWRLALHYTWVNRRKNHYVMTLCAAYADYQDRAFAGMPHPSLHYLVL